MTAIKIGNRTITNDSVRYLIAEISVNHEGSIDKARDLIPYGLDGWYRDDGCSEADIADLSTLISSC
jgi:hypothetical protein